MKRVLCFGLTLAMMMTLLMTSALAVDSEDTMEKTTTADKEQKALRLNDVVSTDDYKENIFNSILNSVDYYDAVEGSFVTTLWREDGEPTVVSYGSDIRRVYYSATDLDGIGDSSTEYLSKDSFTYSNINYHGLSISAASFIDIVVSNPNSDPEMKTFSLSVSPTIFD